MENIKSLMEMRRHEWVAWRWKEVTTVTDTCPMFVRGIHRSPDEAISAGKDFDALWEALRLESLYEEQKLK